MCSNVSFYLLQCCYFICQGGIVFSKCCIYIECLQSYRSKFIFYFSDFLRDLFYIPAKFRTALVVLSWLFYVLLGVVFVCIHEILLYHKLKFITSKVYIFMYYFLLLWIKHLELLLFCLRMFRAYTSLNKFIYCCQSMCFYGQLKLPRTSLAVPEVSFDVTPHCKQNKCVAMWIKW